MLDTYMRDQSFILLLLYIYDSIICIYNIHRYLVTHLMGADLNNIVRTQKLSDDHVQFLVYQILRGLKYIHSAGIIHRVCEYLYIYEKKMQKLVFYI